VKREGTPRERLAWLLVFAAVLALAYTEFTDGDLGFHLATGREILSRGRIPDTNVLSYTNPTYPWHLHQWLPGVLFEWLWQRHGTGALQALKVLLVFAIWLVAYATARVMGASREAAALATLWAASAAAFRFELRPYLFTHLALALELWCCAHYLRACEQDAHAGMRKAWGGAVLVPALACHLHAGVIDSWLVLLALSCTALAEPVRARVLAVPSLAPNTPRHAGRLAGALAASVALAALGLELYHPIGARILLFPFDMGSDSYLAEHLVEFRTPLRFPFQALAAYWGLVGSVLTLLLVRRRSLHLFWPALCLGFLLLSLKHVRLVFGFALVVTPVLALGLEPLLSRLRPALRLGLLAALCAAALVFRYQQAAPGSALSVRTFPPYLFRYLEVNALHGPDYVSDAWAAPLLGRAYPARKAFFDNRFEAYPRRFFLDVYQHIRYGLSGWDKLLDRYGVELVLMRYTTPGEATLQHGKPNLRQRITQDPRWSLVTFDDLGMLVLRQGGSNAAHARAFALPYVDPDSLRFWAAPRLSLPGLRRELSRGNTSTRLLLLAAQAELDAGNQTEAKRLLSRAAERPDSEELFARLQGNRAAR
jgi:hypothetical protein